MRSGVLAVGAGFCWRVYEVRDAQGELVDGAAVYIERRGDGLRGLLRHDVRGWWTAGFHGNRMNVPDHVVDTIRGTVPYGAYLLDEQAELVTAPPHRRVVRGIPWTVECPDCGANVLVGRAS